MATKKELAEEAEKAMATKLGRKMIEVWASTIDALFQEWQEKQDNGDRLGLMIVSCQISQVGNMVMQYFKGMGEEFIFSETELKAAKQAVVRIDAMVRQAMSAAGIGNGEKGPEPDSGPVTQPIPEKGSEKPDRSLN